MQKNQEGSVNLRGLRVRIHGFVCTWGGCGRGLWVRRQSSWEEGRRGRIHDAFEPVDMCARVGLGQGWGCRVVSLGIRRLVL